MTKLAWLVGISLVTWLYFGWQRERPERREPLSTERSSYSERSESSQIVRGTSRSAVGSQEKPTESVSTTTEAGTLVVRFVGRDERDRLWLAVVSADGTVHTREAVVEEELWIGGLVAGDYRIELQTRVGASLAEASASVRAGESNRATLPWLAPLPVASLGTVSGAVVLPESAHEHGLVDKLKIQLTPHHDSDVQARTNAVPRQLPVRRMSPEGPNRYAFELSDVATGSYSLDLFPLGMSRRIQVRTDQQRVFVEFAPSHLGRTLLSFTDEQGVRVWPARVLARPAGEARMPLLVPLQRREDWNAYDWLAAPGDYIVSIQDPRFGSRNFPCTVRSGWEERHFELEEVFRAQVMVLDVPDARMKPLTVAGLDGGEVFASYTRTLPNEEDAFQFEFQVDRPGRYALTYESNEFERQLVVAVDSRQTTATWDLDEREPLHPESR